MSLIHDALKSMDAPEQSRPAAVAPPRAPAPVAAGRPGWVDALLAFAAVLGAGFLGWWLWQSQMQPKADLTPAAVAPVRAMPQPAPVPPQPVALATQPAAPVEPLSPPLAGMPAPAAAPTATDTAMAAAPQGAAPGAMPVPPVQPATPAAAPGPAVAKAPVTVARNESAAAPRPAVSRPARASRSAPQAVAAPEAAPVVDDTPVELRFARFVTAMRGGQKADAERELAALKARLPAGSIGLLRAQAWFDLREGRDAAAAEGYRAIIERMPADEEAAINLASIQARQNKTEEARATLDAAVRLQPDSAALRAALAQFTPNARQ